MAYLSGYSYRKIITLSRASGAVTNYQMKLLVGESSGATGEDVNCGGHVSSDFKDIRFTKADGTTLLDYWIESITGTTPNQLATIWIEFDSIGITATEFYMYYGNSSAVSASSGANTFLFFDDFNNLNDGDLNGQNGWSGSAYFDVESSVKYEGEKAVQISNTSNQSIDHTLTVTSYNMFIQLQMRTSTVSAEYPIEFYLMEGTNQITAIGIRQSYITHMKSGPAWQNVMAASNDEWYKCRLAIDSSSTHKIWINDNIQAPVSLTNGTNVSSTINKLRLEQFSGAGVSSYIDQIIVGQYLATEPTWGSWGEEENITSDTSISKIMGISTGSLTKFMNIAKGSIIKIGGLSYGRTTYAIWNPNDKGLVTISNKNLTVVNAHQGLYNSVRATIGKSSGKWYWEFTCGGGTDQHIGVVSSVTTLTDQGFWVGSAGFGYGSYYGKKYNNNSSADYGNTWTTGAVIGVALDMDTGKIWFSKNGVWQGATKSLLYFNGEDGSQTIVDAKGKSWTAYGNAQLDTSDFKFDTSCLLLDGNGDCIYAAPDSDFTIGSGNYTIDLQTKLAQNKECVFFACRSASGVAYGAGIDASNHVYFYVYQGATGHYAFSTGTVTSDGNWHHLEFARDGNTIRIWIDGNPDGTDDVTGVTVDAAATEITIGCAQGKGTYFVNGKIDMVRFSKGVVRHTGSFTPPPAAYGIEPVDSIDEAYSGLTGTLYPVWDGNGTSDYGTINFGNLSFSYTPPSGFSAFTGSPSWFSTYDQTSAWTFGTNGASMNFRMIYSGADFKMSGSKVRLTIKAHNAQTQTLTGVSIGERLGSTISTVGPQTRETFDGGSSSVTLSAGVDKVSDEINFEIDETKQYLVHVFQNEGSSSDYAYAYTGGRYFLATTNDDTMTQSPAGYNTSQVSGNTSYVSKIEIYSVVPTSYATWNPSDKGSEITLSNRNNTATKSGVSSAFTNGGIRSSIGKSSGKWYFEYTYTEDSGSNWPVVGVGNLSANMNDHVGSDANGWGVYAPDGDKYHSDTGADYGTSFTQGDIIGVALDMNNGKVWFSKNGTWFNSGDPGAGTNEAYSGLTGTIYAFIVMYQPGSIWTANFGATSLSYVAPSGFKSGLYS